MANYYQWRKSTIKYTKKANRVLSSGETISSSPSDEIYRVNTFTTSGVNFVLPVVPGQGYIVSEFYQLIIDQTYFMVNQTSGPAIYQGNAKGASLTVTSSGYALRVGGTITQYILAPESDVQQGYVYSASPSAYPNGGAQGDYYYDQRTTIDSPTTPPSFTIPNPITSNPVTVSWAESTSNIPGSTIKFYTFYWAARLSSGSLKVSENQAIYGTSTVVQVPLDAVSIEFHVYSVDTNSQASLTLHSGFIPVFQTPILAVPSQAMQGQPISVNWTAVTGTTSYTLQRKADTDGDWVEVYSGSDLTFTETVGAWTTVQYRIQAVFDGTPGGWSDPVTVPVVSASALVISGQDGDLGTLTEDVPYTVSSDTGNPITLARTVNGVQVASLTVESGFAYSIPVMDLPTGTGTIVITATVETSSDPVTATRTWTYTKTPFSFPDTGGTAQLQQEGKNVFPATLAECVRVGANLGGNLGLALQALANSAQYDPETGGFTDPAGNTIPVPKIETGSYVGTGTYGESNPNGLTFPFSPKIGVFHRKSASDSEYAYILFVRGVLASQTLAGSTGNTTNNTWSENGIKWYAAFDYSQMNVNGVEYYYVFIG